MFVIDLETMFAKVAAAPEIAVFNLNSDHRGSLALQGAQPTIPRRPAKFDTGTIARHERHPARGA